MHDIPGTGVFSLVTGSVVAGGDVVVRSVRIQCTDRVFIMIIDILLYNGSHVETTQTTQVQGSNFYSHILSGGC